MSSSRDIHLAIITCHDFLFFASQDYGSVARPLDYIGNYALMYALNRNDPMFHRTVSGSTPFYDEDLPRMSIYATPAAKVTEFPHRQSEGKWIGSEYNLGEGTIPSWTHQELTKITWNCVGEKLSFTMRQDNLNMPKKGIYYKFSPLTSFYFYVIGEPLPTVFRLGKKYAAVRARFYKLQAKRKTGEFSPTCPVTVVDLPAETSILRGSLITMPPSPILINARLKGRYFECSDEYGTKHIIPRPDVEKYENSLGDIAN